jgi:carboxylesterase
LGCNVLVPREPHHGLVDRMTAVHSRLTARGLVRFASAAVDIALGLGEQVTVAGLSMGGLLAAWAAQNRADIARAGLISPAFGFQAIPRRLAPLVARLVLALPNFFIWWDPKIKDAPHPPYHSYPRYATLTLGHLLHLSRVVRKQARRSPPKARQVVVITNPCDPSVDNRLAAQLLDAWQAAGAQNVSAYEFDRRHNLLHDLIDPEQPQEQVGVVYPILLELLAE